MANQIKISFIIPSYNAGGVLERAVHSILHGAVIGSVEVIIVENGSTDDTNEVAEKLVRQYNITQDGQMHELVRFFHSKKGVSNARNKGIEEARGEWISFVDADDQMTDDGIHLMMLDSLSSKADMIIYSHMAGVDKRGVMNGPIEYHSYGEEYIEGIRVRMITNPTKYMQAWGKLLRTDNLLKNNVMFNPEMSLSEDSDFILRYSAHCRQIDFSSAIVYRYSVDMPSTIRTYDGKKAERFADALERTSKVVAFESPVIQKAFRQYVLMNMNVIMVREVWERSNPHTDEEKLEMQKTVAKKTVFKKAIHATSIFQCRTARMVPILCMKLNLHKLASVVYKKRVSDNARLSEQSAVQTEKEAAAQAAK